MADITMSATDVRPLNGAIIRRAKAAAALAFGNAVYIASATGDIPNVNKAAGGALATAVVYGIVVSPSPDNPGATSIASGDQCDVVVFGPVAGFTGMTPGANIWLSDTAGAVADAVGTKSNIVGIAESATVLFVNPLCAVKSS